MLPKELNLFLRKCKNKVFIYAWEYFTRRIHDELLRSAVEESPFFYVEMNFNVVEEKLPASNDRLIFWKAFFEVLPSQKRLCDLCGFLKNDEGIAILFVDTVDNNPAWSRFCAEIQTRTHIDMQTWDGIIYADYPPKEFFAT